MKTANILAYKALMPSLPVLKKSNVNTTVLSLVKPSQIHNVHENRLLNASFSQVGHG